MFGCWHPVPPKDYEEISFYIGFGALYFDRFRTRENLKGGGRAIELMCDTTAKSFEGNKKFQELLDYQALKYGSISGLRRCRE